MEAEAQNTMTKTAEAKNMMECKQKQKYNGTEEEAKNLMTMEVDEQNMMTMTAEAQNMMAWKQMLRIG